MREEGCLGFVVLMNDTPNLALPYILAAQAQKHVTHNEAIRALDCLVQLSIASRTLSEPPTSPEDGTRYIVANRANGDWADQDGKVAAYQDGAWVFYAPKEGWRAWAVSESALLVYEAGAWLALPSGGNGEGGGGDLPTAFDSLTHVGVNATADTTNRLSLKSPASLFDNEGAGHQQKINKKTSSDTASVLYQTNYSGRAETGLAGDDDYHFKVSPDGSTWYDAIKIDRNTGRIAYPIMGGPREVLTSNRTYYVRTDGSDGNDGLSDTTGGAFATIQKAIDAAASLDLSIFDVTIQLGAGTYTLASTVTCKSAVGAGAITVQGDLATPSNVVITSASTIGNTFLVKNHKTTYKFQGFKIESSGYNNFGITVSTGAYAEYGNVDFGSFPGTTSQQLRVEDGGVLKCIAAYKISGGAGIHLCANGGGNIRCQFQTVALTGTPAFAFAFLNVEYASQCIVNANTFSGTATGVRYNVVEGSLIKTNGAGATYLPGNAAGTSATQGLYV